MCEDTKLNIDCILGIANDATCAKQRDLEFLPAQSQLGSAIAAEDYHVNLQNFDCSHLAIGALVGCLTGFALMKVIR